MGIAVGFTTNLEDRLERHRDGRGSPLIQAAHKAGIAITVARVWDNVTYHYPEKLEYDGHWDYDPAFQGDQQFGGQISSTTYSVGDTAESEPTYTT